MEIVNIKIKDLKPYEKNAKRHDQTQIDNVAKSIHKYGFVQPLVIDKNNVVIIGHCRLEASKKLKLKEVPCVLADTLTDEQVKELRLLDNKLNESDFDFDLLSEELADLDLSDFELDWGIEELESEKEVEEDNFDVDGAIPEEPKAKLGDIYQLGEHRLMCGDSTKEEDVAKLMDRAKDDMVFTDPPYGNGDSGKYGRGQLGIRTILNDKNIECFNNFIDIIPTDKIIYFLQWRTLSESLQKVKEKGLKINTVGVWDKKNAGLNGAGGISEQWEAIVFAGNIKYKKFGGNVFSVAREQHKRENSPHPHQKPLKLLGEILDFIDGANIILDPFGGSGSTLIACEQLGRKCYMMELDEKYVDVIIKRWEDFTGKKAVKL